MPTIKARDSFNKAYVDVLVDECDLDLSKYYWHLSGQGYVYRKQWIGKKQKSVYLHKEIVCRISGNCSCKMGDHIDGNKLDNRRSNLRVATVSQNQFNRRMDKRNKSGYFGVDFDKKRGKWRAQGCVGYKHTMIGRFDSPEEAALARDKWAIENHGEFARLNFPELAQQGTV